MVSPTPLFVYGVWVLILAVNVSTLIPFFGAGACARSYGQDCSDSEKALQNYLASWLFSIGLSILVLTSINKNNPAKIKRLSIFVAYILMTAITVFLMGGSKSVGGVYPVWVHVTALVIYIVLIFMVRPNIANDESMCTPHTPIYADMGLNMKGYVALVTISLVVWMFFSSDFQGMSGYLASPSGSLLELYLWNCWSVCAFEASIVGVFVLTYGDDKDYEGLTLAWAASFLVSILVVVALGNLQIASNRTFSYIQNSIFIVLGMAAVIRYRMSGRADYEQV
jgi:hypothetical protein